MHRVLPAFARVSFAAGVSFRTVSNRRVILGDNDLRGVVDGFGASSQFELWLCSHAGDDRQSAAEPIQHSAAIDKQSAAVGVYQHQGGRGFVSGKATDKSGNPVTMFIGPNLETEVTTVGLNDQASDPKKGNAEIRSGGMFTSLPPRTNLARKRSVWMCTTMPIRTSVRSRMWPTTGESVNGYVIGVGGFLGIGDHYVAVRPSAVKLSYDAKDKKWHASMDANADQLKAAPEFKYPSNT